MTLLEMIKKYERVKKNVEKMQDRVPPFTHNLSRIVDDIEVVDTILNDLKSVRDQQPSWVTLRDKVMKKIDKELDLCQYTEAEKLTRILSLLPE